MARFLLSLALVVVSAASLAAQVPPEWTLFVAGNEVVDIVDHEGVAWFATIRGLVRFDRSSGVKTFFEKGNSGLPDVPVNSVSIDSAGGVWVSYSHDDTRSGFARFDGTQWTVHGAGVVSGQGFGMGYDVSVAPDGGVWALIRNGRVAQLEDGQWRTVSAGQLSPMSERVVFDSRGRLWASVPYLGVARLDGSSWTTFTPENSALPNSQVLAIEPDADGGVWVATSAGIAHVADSGSSSVTIDEITPYSNWISGLAVDENGVLWASNLKDLYRLDGARMQRVAVTDSLGFITTLAPASGGGVWVGTRSGAHHVDGTTVSTVGTSSIPLASDNVSSIVVDRSGVLWGAVGGDIVRFDGTTWSVIDTNEHHLQDFSIAAGLVDRRGRVWFATAQRGVSMYDGTSWRNWDRSHFTTQNLFVSIAEDREGVIWVAGATVTSFDGVTWTRHERFPALSDSAAYAIAVDSVGGLWVGTYGAGIHRYHNGLWSVHLATEGWPTDIVVGPDGQVYVTYIGTLATFDGATWSIRREAGDIETILPLANGSTWFAYSGWSGNGNGVARLDGSRWTSYVRHGGPLPDGNVTDLAAAPDGSIWIGTRAGLARFAAPASSITQSHQRELIGPHIDALHPNPAHAAMQIRFTLPSSSEASLDLYDLLGRRAAVLAGGRFEAGTHAVDAHIAHLPPGSYHLRLVTGNGTATRPVIVR